MNNRTCKKCLLLEAGEKASYNTVSEYISNLSDDIKVADDEYNRRLSFCKSCDNLISGMCRKCGCYVEIRAALIDSDCPNVDDKKW